MAELYNPNLEFITYGRQPVLEALRSGNVAIKSVWMARDAQGKIMQQIKALTQKKKIPLEYLPKNAFQRITGAVVHQGIAARVQFNPFVAEDGLAEYLSTLDNPLLLLLDQMQDANNLGAILRTAEITGVNLIILPSKGSAPINATIAKTSAGALFKVRLLQTDHLPEIISMLQEQNISVIATMPQAQQNIYEENFTNPVAIVVGSENRGVRKNLLERCDRSVAIPQFGRINSLNASVSTAVVLYEVIRQRTFKD